MPTLSLSDSDIKAANAALAQIGVKPIGSFTDAGVTARTLNQLYLDVLEQSLAEHPWRFAQMHQEVFRLPDAAPPPWEGLYAVPADLVLLRNVWHDDRKVPFDRFETGIAVPVSADDTGRVSVQGTRLVGAAAWPGYFRRAFITKLAAEIAMPITQDERLTAYLKAEAQELLGRARSRDSQGRTASRIDTKLFIRHRRGLGRR